jgi:hypothetical protein
MVTVAPQLMRSINGFNKVATNTDGSIDLYFGPQKLANVADSNWIQTANRRDFLVALRLLWHWRRVLRSELEAGRGGEGEVAAIPDGTSALRNGRFNAFSNRSSTRT